MISVFSNGGHGCDASPFGRWMAKDVIYSAGTFGTIVATEGSQSW